VVWEKAGEKKQAATNVAARFLYMVVLYMVPKTEKAKGCRDSSLCNVF